MKGELKDTKSIFCSMVLRLMDTEEYSNNYCKSLDLVLRLFPEIDGELLEKELLINNSDYHSFESKKEEAANFISDFFLRKQA